MRLTRFRGISLGCSSLLLVGILQGCGGGGDSDPSDAGLGGSGAVGSGGQSSGEGSGGQQTASGGSLNAECPGELTNAYQGHPARIPGVVEAEDFDPEGYFDATPGNEGGAFRSDVDVDIKELGDGYAIGWMTAGEWLEYTVNVEVAGKYRVELRAGAVEAGRTLALSLCGRALAAPIAVPLITDWGSVATVATEPVQLSAGLQVIRVTVGENDYVDLDSLSFVLVEEDTGTGGNNGTGGGDGSGGDGGALPKFVGNITTGSGHAVDTNGLKFSDYWDQITPENAGKWDAVQPSASHSLNWTVLDAIYDYTQKNKILFKQHTFVWGSQQPSGNLTEAQVKAWIYGFCGRYPNTKLIDVVNEPPPHTTPSYAETIGGGTGTTWQWVINSFKWARDACPGAILILNDYNNIEWEDQTNNFIKIAKAVKDAGDIIDAVGAQAHGLSTETVPTDKMKRLLTKLHTEIGLPVYITEYDIDLADDQAQLKKFQEHIPFFLEQEWIPGITLWGWIHGQTWMDHTGLIRNGAPRPALRWLMEELERPVPPTR